MLHDTSILDSKGDPLNVASASASCKTMQDQESNPDSQMIQDSASDSVKTEKVPGSTHSTMTQLHGGKQPFTYSNLNPYIRP
jgi:hypothetical protein